MYAIVDIETTGGQAGPHRITEIAIVLHDGTRMTEQYTSLVNPLQDIPPFISQLTGISNEMVATAPVFGDLAEEIHTLLKDRIFVAHNAAFDYSFVKKMFEEEGYPFQAKKLCTVKLSRKILPGHRSYSLGNICRDLNITVENRHRAMGDAAATTILFEKLLASDQGGVVDEHLNKHQGHQALPPHLEKSVVQALPSKPGVYYFHDKNGRLLYVGKARNIRSRVKNHFNYADHDGHENKLREEIYDVSCTETGNEFIALLLELDEIKRKKPPYNKALKFWSRNYCVFSFVGQDGYRHLAMERYRNGLQPMKVFPNLLMTRAFLKEMVEAHQLCPAYCHLQKKKGPCYQRATQSCLGACTGEEDASIYNQRVEAAIQAFGDETGTFILKGKGRLPSETSVVLVEKGHYLGFGFVPDDEPIAHIDNLRDYIQWRPDHPEIQYLIMRQAEKHPSKRIRILSTTGPAN